VNIRYFIHQSQIVTLISTTNDLVA